MFEAIQVAEDRLAIAKRIAAELCGKRNELHVRRIGEYTIVEDGHDRWIQDTETYNESCELFLQDVIGGEYDCYDTYEDIDWYSDFCQESQRLYSAIGSPSDKQELYEAIKDSDKCDEILEAMGVNKEELEEISVLVRISDGKPVAVCNRLPSGTVVEAAFSRSREAINANRQWNLVNSFRCKVSNAKALANTELPNAVAINEGVKEFFIQS